MPREVYLIVYPVKVKTKVNASQAHWAIFVPRPGSTTKGKAIHVVGSPFTGFVLEFKRNYDLTKTARPISKFSLGVVDDEHIVDTPSIGDSLSKDTTPVDTLEKESTKISAPTISSSPLDPSVGRRCQEWIREYVALLVQGGIMPTSAITVLDEAKAMEI